jgi:serine protease
MVEGHEYAETITDQNPAGGWTNTTSRTYSGQENADECAWISPGSAGGAGNVSTTSGSFAMQATWSNDTNRCDLSHVTVG